MDSKQTITIAVVVILIIAGTGVGIFFAIKNNGGPAVDKVKDKVEVGDYIVSNMTIYGEMSTTKEEFLGGMYYTGDGSPVDQETIAFHGKKYTCDVYVDVSAYRASISYASETSKVVFMMKEYGDNFAMEYTLTEANSLDVEKTLDEQNLTDGASYTYESNRRVSGEDLIGSYIFTYNHDEDGNEMMETESTISQIYKVSSVADNQVTLESGGKMSIREFRSHVSVSDWKDYMHTEGGWEDVGESEKKTETVSTPFGDRNVTIETITMKDQIGLTQTYVLTYGEQGFLYSVEYDSIELVLFVVKTSMRV